VNYFIPLTSKKESFTAQWNKLEKLFSSKKWNIVFSLLYWW
jgi:hypothetical protein